GNIFEPQAFFGPAFDECFHVGLFLLVVLPCEDVYCPRKRPPGLLSVYQDLCHILALAPYSAGIDESRRGFERKMTHIAFNSPRGNRDALFLESYRSCFLFW